jgi:pimeloyl-ACP methyl ester carboxylesterase
MRADTLAQLVKGLGLGPVVLAGGSGGARDSMVTALLYPGLATRLVLWNIVGGVYSSMNLLGVYNMPSLRTVLSKGMAGVVEMSDWAEIIALNPANRDRFLALDADDFWRVMRRWLNAFIPKAGQTIPGVEDQDFEALTLPALIVRGGEDDLDHPKRTSLEVSVLIKGSKLVEPPWPEDAWERAVERASRGEGSIFEYWYMAAPLILEFVGQAG